MTKEELKNLTECLKKEEFRKLLIEYAEEVTDPENRKTYEREITQLEKERGVDVTFVNPEPGYVIKTSVNGERKCFLNISKSEIVARPSSQPSYEEGHRGLHWSIPYTLIPPRDDLDRRNARCTVFDVVFHPDTIYLTSKNARFREIVNNTAMDGVESNFQVKLDRKNVKFPKIGYKGVSHPTVIRRPSKEPAKEKLDIDPEIYQKLIASYDESRERQTNCALRKAKRASPPTTYYQEKPVKPLNETETVYATPKFSVKHWSDIDLEDFVVGRDAKMHAAIPKKLIITVDLPLLKSAADANLDVQERFLSVKSEKPSRYLLELPLPYSVDADQGNAKFDSKHKKLTVTLPVVRRKSIPLTTDAREDSGVDSDHGSPVPLFLDDPVTDSTGTHQQSEPMPKLVEECEAALAGTVLEDKSERAEECRDTALRTSNGKDTAEEFLSPDIKYTLPAFTCNIYDNQLAVTINVKNVDPSSIRHRIIPPADAGLHVTLASIGAGLFPQYYSLCLKLGERSLDPDSLAIEPWDNNVVCAIGLRNTETLSRYYVGLDEELMEERDLPTAASFKNQLKELTVTEDMESESNCKVEVQPEDNGVVVSIHSSQLESEEETEQQHRQQQEQRVRRQNRRHVLAKSRSVSESSGDELTNTGSSTKGILKSRRSNLTRSMSESSADENGILISSADCHYDSVHDVNSESDCSSLKKTVRFNDVVSRQLFRTNSSILGQRKKNQRKLRNKKRAMERRMSESENSETEERDKYRVKEPAEPELLPESVKPILHREKQSTSKQERTAADCEIEMCQHGSNDSSLEKRKSRIEEEPTRGELHSECPLETAGPSDEPVKAEFKNDLIFDLDI